jgi:uncharacterized protein (UPF0335 family)
MPPEIADKVNYLIERLDRVHQKRKSVEKELSSIYAEAANSNIDVYALKASLSCRFSPDTDIASIYWMLCKYMRPQKRADRAVREATNTSLNGAMNDKSNSDGSRLLRDLDRSAKGRPGTVRVE